MTKHRALSAALVTFAAAGAATLYLYHEAPPGCTGDPALSQVYAVLRNKFHLDSIFLNDIRTVSGDFFSGRYDCTAQVTTIRGNQNVSDMSWRAVRYAIVYRSASPGYTVTVELGGETPFVRQKLSFWQRLFGGR